MPLIVPKRSEKTATNHLQTAEENRLKENQPSPGAGQELSWTSGSIASSDNG
jgi:hypothetical protein